MKTTVLAAEKLSKRFGQSNEPVLNNIDISVYENDFTIIMGASGSGKSTLLYTLSGMDTPSQGNIFYKGELISAYTENQMAYLRAHDFGFVFQQTHLVSNLTLFENVAVPGYLNKTRGEKVVRERTDFLLTQMQVKDARHRLPAAVSGGEAQRAAIARALIHEPTLLFADEPTGALNRKNGEQVLDLLTHIHETGQSILMVTHDLRAAIRGTRLLYLEDGAIKSELTLPIFLPSSVKEREEQVNHWLSGAGW